MKSNTTEELLLAIADRLNNADGGTATAATTAKAGVVKMVANVAETAGDAPTAEEFKALLDALISASITDAIMRCSVRIIIGT